MKLKSLEIELGQSWEDHAGKYLAKIEYVGEKGKVEMQLDSTVSEAIMVCIGDTITKFAARAAEDIKKNIYQSLEEAKHPREIEE